MKVAVVGAGFAGLATAKVMRDLGVEVVVYERCDDVGGVWSASRRYPGVRTQNDKGTYALSGLKMPRHYPQWPSGHQVQQYLESYVAAFDLAPLLHLGTEVVRAVEEAGGWRLELRGPDGATTTDTADHLVVANGIFSEPSFPDLPGRAEFEAAGGQVLATSEFHDLGLVRDRHVVVLGYGKSSCDVSVPVSAVAASTTVVARQLLWKMPRAVGGVVNYKFLMLTRLGEALFRYLDLSGVEKFLHGPGDGVRRGLLGGLQGLITRQLGLERLGLTPRGSFEDIARSTVSLVTEGFFAAVRSGAIDVRRDDSVIRLLTVDGRPHVELAGGGVLPADLVLCGTGFRQSVPFLDDEVQSRFLDDSGDFRLHLHIQPIDVPHLSFAGYNSSFFSPLSAEVAAIWIANMLLTDYRMPPREETLTQIDRRLAWMQERTRGRHGRGTNVIPFSMHTIDAVLDDIDLNIPASVRALQWLVPVDPSRYRSVLTRLEERTAGRRPAPQVGGPSRQP